MDHAISTALIANGLAPSGTVTKTGDGEFRREVSVPASTNDVAVNLVWTNSLLQSLYMLSDQDILIETNSSSSPAATLTLKANVPFAWQKDGYFANPFVAANVTALYLSNAGGTAANVKLYGLIDSTP